MPTSSCLNKRNDDPAVFFFEKRGYHTSCCFVVLLWGTFIKMANVHSENQGTLFRRDSPFTSRPGAAAALPTSGDATPQAPVINDGRPPDPAQAAQVLSHWSEAPAPSGGTLDGTVRRQMEHQFGEDFSTLKIERGVPGAEHALGARAVAGPEHIAVDPAILDHPHHPEHKQVIAEELAHVVQKRRGSTVPDALDAALSGGDKLTADGGQRDPLEHEAKHAAARAVAGHRVAIASGARAPARQFNLWDWAAKKVGQVGDQIKRFVGGKDPAAAPKPQAEKATKPKTDQEKVDEALGKAQQSLTPKGFIFKDVKGNDATSAMDTLLALPKELQGQAVAKLDADSFGRMLSKVPVTERERFKALVDNTADPERKLRLFGEYQKAHTENDAAHDKEAAKDEGSFYWRNDQQKENRRKNQARDGIVAETRSEVDAEVQFLLDKAKSGKLSDDAINRYMASKESEHKQEMGDLKQRPATLDGLPDADRVDFVKGQAEKLLVEKGIPFFKSVSGGDAIKALETIKSLPPNLQGETIAKLDAGAFDRFLTAVPAQDRQSFDTLVQNTHDPERKLRLYGEYHKAKASADAAEERKKTSDEGSFWGRSDEQKENRRKNQSRDEIVKTTKDEMTDEVDFLREQKKTGTLSEAHVNQLIQRKDHEHDIEMKYNVNLTNKRGTRKYSTNSAFAQGSKIAWSDGELSQLESGLARMPIDHVSGNSALVKVERSDIDPDDETALLKDPAYKPKYGGDHLNNVIRIEDLGVNGNYRHTGDARELADPKLAGLGGPTISPVEETIIHEFGHDIHDQKGDIFKRFQAAAGWQRGAYDPGRIPQPTTDPLTSPTPNNRGGDTWSYARTKPGEHFAETYMKAVLKPQALAHDLIDAPAARVNSDKQRLEAAKNARTALDSRNPPATTAEKAQADQRLKDAAANVKAAEDDQTGQNEQFRIMREDVFHSDKATTEAEKRLAAKGVAKEKLDEFRSQAARASTPEQVAVIEQGIAP